jgi:hypothetical protein
MTQVYKLPTGINVQAIRELKGCDGRLSIEPIEDADGNWIVSIEEFDNPYFQYIKDEFPEVINQMELIDFKEKPRSI